MMKRMRFYYLDTQVLGKLDQVLGEFTAGHADDVMKALNQTLPIVKWNDKSLRRHVEGMFYLSEKLWTFALELGKKTWGAEFSRENLLRITKTMPMSHYSYLVGSREPATVLLTRDDILQDPATAMVKLQHDIKSLSDFILSTRTKA
jgi:hypothetical protein